MNLYQRGISVQEISKSLGRGLPAVKNKLRKLNKVRESYSQDEKQKYSMNERWIRLAQKNKKKLRVLDGYAGTGKSTEIYAKHASEVIACEIKKEKFVRLLKRFGAEKTNEKEVKIDFNGAKIVLINDDVRRVMFRMLGNSTKPFDFIDLDPCGSCFDVIPNAIKLIDNGFLAVTYGELQSVRWGRHDVLLKSYLMPKTSDFRKGLGYMIGWTLFEGARQPSYTKTRKLKVIDIKCIPNIQKGVARTLFKVTEIGALADVLNYLANEVGLVDNWGNVHIPYFDSERLGRKNAVT